MEKIKTSQAGFTLFELLISLSVGSILMMTVLSSLTNVYQSRSRFQFSNRLLSVSESVFSQLTTDMHNSQSAEVGFEQITMTTLLGERIIYQLDSSTHRLLRNGAAITPSDVKIQTFGVTQRSPADTLPLIGFDLELTSLDSRIANNLNLQKQTTISLRTNKGNPNETE